MRPTKCVTFVATLSALALCLATSNQGAESKGANAHRGGQASSHMSSKGQENTNAQWSADPERGWVRAEERHEGYSEEKTKQNRGQKGNDSKAKVAKGSSKDH